MENVMENFKTDEDVVGGVAAAAARLSAWPDGNVAHWRPPTAHTQRHSQQYVSHNFYRELFASATAVTLLHMKTEAFVYTDVKKRAPKSLFNIVCAKPFRETVALFITTSFSCSVFSAVTKFSHSESGVSFLNEAQRQLSAHTVANNSTQIRSQFCSVCVEWRGEI